MKKKQIIKDDSSSESSEYSFIPSIDISDMLYTYQKKPSWDEKSTHDPSFILSDEDWMNKSMVMDSLSERRCEFANIDYGVLGNLLMFMSDGVVWCSWRDVLRVAGLRGHPNYVNGYCPQLARSSRLGKEGEIHHYPILGKDGLLDVGIPYPEAASALMSGRGGGHLVARLLAWYAIFDSTCEYILFSILEKIEMREPFFGSVLDLWKPHLLCFLRFHDPKHGEIRALRLGTRVWFLLDDIQNVTICDKESLVKTFGQKNFIVFPNRLIHDSLVLSGQSHFISSDCTIKFLGKRDVTSQLATDLTMWLVKRIFSHLALQKSGGIISGKTLHSMIGGGEDFVAWMNRLTKKHPNDIKKMTREASGQSDIQIPIHIAHKLAVNLGTFPGKVTATLLRDGGFLHRGEINEFAENSLLRFRDLVPNRFNRIPVRKIWEFCPFPGSFKKWLEYHKRKGVKLGETVPISHKVCEELWLENTRY